MNIILVKKVINFFISKHLISFFLKNNYFRLKFGDLVFIKYILFFKKTKKYFYKIKTFFGKCIFYKGELFKKTLSLRKAIKLNVVEQVFLLDSPFIILIKNKLGYWKRGKKFLWLRKMSARFSIIKEISFRHFGKFKKKN